VNRSTLLRKRRKLVRRIEKADEAKREATEALRILQEACQHLDRTGALCNDCGKEVERDDAVVADRLRERVGASLEELARTTARDLGLLERWVWTEVVYLATQRIREGAQKVVEEG